MMEIYKIWPFVKQQRNKQSKCPMKALEPQRIFLLPHCKLCPLKIRDCRYHEKTQTLFWCMMCGKAHATYQYYASGISGSI